jgi:hypothetical protein
LKNQNGVENVYIYHPIVSAYMTWYNIIANADARNGLPIEQPISEHIVTHLATKTEPILIKIDYCVVSSLLARWKITIAPRYAALSKGPPQIVVWEQDPQFSCRRAPQDLLEVILDHKLAKAILSMAVEAPLNEWNCAQTRSNCSEWTDWWGNQTHAAGMLKIRRLEFYEYTGHENSLKYA